MDLIKKENCFPNNFHKRYFGHEVRIQVVRESSPEQDYWINNAKDAYYLVKDQMETLDREAFLVASMDIKNRLLGLNLVSLGILNQCIVHPREVFKPAILLNAMNILLMHNHPAGNPEPSTNDTQITGRLIEAGKLLGIPVLDHVIVGKNRFYSFVDEGLINR